MPFASCLRLHSWRVVALQVWVVLNNSAPHMTTATQTVPFLVPHAMTTFMMTWVIFALLLAAGLVKLWPTFTLQLLTLLESLPVKLLAKALAPLLESAFAANKRFIAFLKLELLRFMKRVLYLYICKLWERTLVQKNVYTVETWEAVVPILPQSPGRSPLCYSYHLAQTGFRLIGA